MRGHKGGGGSTPNSTSELVGYVYRMAADPRSYDDFMERWEAYVADAMRNPEFLEFESGGPLIGSTSFAGGLSQHFQLGFQLLGQLGRKATNPNPEDFDETRTVLLMDSGGRVVWFNGAAGRVLGITEKTTLDTIPMGVEPRNTFKNVLAAFRAGSESNVPSVLPLTTTNGGSTLIAVSIVRDSSDQPAILFRELRPGWRREASDILRNDLGLTQSEIDVVRLMTEGQNVQEIAEAKSNSVETVRAHVKSILSKTGARSQTELVRLAMTILRLVERTAREKPAHFQSPTESFEVKTGGRSIPVDVFGDPNGRPVIYFHGMLDGCTVTRRMNELLVQGGLKLIVPFRPSYGPAAAPPGSARDATRMVALDILKVASDLKIQRAVLLGHLGGSVYAFAAAAALGDRVARIVNVGGCVPIVSNEQINQMSTRQRLVAWTGRYVPALLPFILRAGIRLLDNGGEEQFALALYRSSKPDRDLLNDPEIHEIVVRGFRLCVAQGHGAFQTDGWQIIQDWSDLVRRTSHPIDLIHGDKDPVVSIKSVRAFAQTYSDRTTLTIARGSGQLVLHSDPQTIVRTLVRGFDGAPG
jgi:pimeloyl-ACP methyl ester carboxylesterase/DNA-binding CsgD family transcriptional regulator